MLFRNYNIALVKIKIETSAWFDLHSEELEPIRPGTEKFKRNISLQFHYNKRFTNRHASMQLINFSSSSFVYFNFFMENLRKIAITEYKYFCVCITKFGMKWTRHCLLTINILFSVSIK